MTNKAPIPLEKRLLLTPISALYEHPHLLATDKTLQKSLAQVFYEVATMLTQQLELSSTHFAYYRDNFVEREMKETIQTIDQLLDYFEWQRRKANGNDSRYLLGFRSIHFILNENIDLIETEYILNVNSLLAPFYNSFKEPALLIPSIVGRN